MGIRVCHCVGHLTNPGGKCCRDLQPEEMIVRGIWSGPKNPPRVKKVEYDESGFIKSIEYFEYEGPFYE